jgi:type IV pilus assembly protein PilC
MAKFIYTAINNQNQRKSGKVEADNREAALKLLAKEGLKPISLKKEGGFDPNNLQFSFFKSKHVKTKDLAIFSRQLSTMVNAGVPLVRSLNLLSQQTENKTLKEAVDSIAKDVEGGETLSAALEKFPKIFSPIYINMVAAGEAGGILDDILKRLAFQQEKDASIKKKIKSAAAYPAVLIVVAAGAFFGLMLFIVPQISKVITDVAGDEAELPFYTQILLNISGFMVTYWYVIILALVAFVFIFKKYISTEKGRYNFHKFLLKVPVIKTIITKVAIARFARIFASLMGAGVSVLDTLAITAKSIGNKVIEEELVEAAQAVKNGQPLSEPLSNSKIFPPIVAQMLAIGEETGEIDTVLVKIADFYEEEVDALIDGLSSIIEPIMIVIMGVMVGLIALSVIGPLSSISKSIK